MNKMREIQEFVKNTKFKGYQGITLPYGVQIQGENLKDTADFIFPKSLKRKSVLDIGCNYGYFCHEAKKRGANEVVGLEVNKKTAKIAKKISSLIGDGVEIINGDIKNLDFKKRFDIILLLNVIHHLINPFEIMEKISKICNDVVIVELPSPSDEGFLARTGKYTKKFIDMNIYEKIVYKATLCFKQQLFKTLQKYPLAMIGDVEYHNTFYFNKKAFYNSFVIHHKLFKKVIFKDSVQKPHRIIAFCKVK